MPIYMDRHDVSVTVTAENVAQLHQEDLKIQDQFGCRGLTYWFDNKRKIAFCLIEAPDRDTIQQMHNIAHGQVPNRIIEVEASIVESFLGRIEDPEKEENAILNIIDDPAFRTIMVVSLKQKWPAAYDTAEWKSSMHKFNNIILSCLNAYDGNLVKQNENLYLVSFKSVSGAVHAAFDIQSSLNEFRNKVLLKIGLSAGMPVTEKKSIFEDTIKLAERMCSIVKGEIIVSAEVKDLYNSEKSKSLGAAEGLIFLTETDEQFITLLIDFTETAWSNENLKVNDFSKPLGYSKSKLYRTMMLLTGKSPNTFLNEYRLNEALSLLNKNSFNISEIAFATGFRSPSYFSKCFLKRYGHLPSGYLASKTAAPL
jgi:AraC-like DNA-binding protein